jgi:hypothetical protein
MRYAINRPYPAAVAFQSPVELVNKLAPLDMAGVIKSCALLAGAPASSYAIQFLRAVFHDAPARPARGMPRILANAIRSLSSEVWARLPGNCTKTIADWPNCLACEPVRTRLKLPRLSREVDGL